MTVCMQFHNANIINILTFTTSHRKEHAVKVSMAKAVFLVLGVSKIHAVETERLVPVSVISFCFVMCHMYILLVSCAYVAGVMCICC